MPVCGWPAGGGLLLFVSSWLHFQADGLIYNLMVRMASLSCSFPCMPQLRAPQVCLCRCQHLPDKCNPFHRLISLSCSLLMQSTKLAVVRRWFFLLISMLELSCLLNGASHCAVSVAGWLVLCSAVICMNGWGDCSKQGNKSSCDDTIFVSWDFCCRHCIPQSPVQLHHHTGMHIWTYAAAKPYTTRITFIQNCVCCNCSFLNLLLI
jgi:hypothetical protein